MTTKPKTKMLNNKPVLRSPALSERPQLHQYIKANCPLPEMGMIFSDIDLMARRRCPKRNIEFLALWEFKTMVKDKDKAIPQVQKLMVQIFSQALSTYFKDNDTIRYKLDSGFEYNQKIKWCGFNTLLMDNTSLENSTNIWLNGKIVTELRARAALSLDVHFRES